MADQKPTTSKITLEEAICVVKRIQHDLVDYRLTEDLLDELTKQKAVKDTARKKAKWIAKQVKPIIAAVIQVGGNYDVRKATKEVVNALRTGWQPDSEDNDSGWDSTSSW